MKDSNINRSQEIQSAIRKSLLLVFLFLQALISQSQITPVDLPRYSPPIDTTFSDHKLIKYDLETGETEILRYIETNEEDDDNTSHGLVEPSHGINQIAQTEMNEERGFTSLIEAYNSSGIPTYYPYSTFVKLIIHTTDGDFSCSGTLVNQRVVLTAAHCVAIDPPNGPIVLSIEVIPAYDNGNSIFPTYYAQSFLTYSGWTNNADYDWDIAFIDINQEVNYTGSLGYGYSTNGETLMSQYYHNFSYPSSDGYGNPVCDQGERMWKRGGHMDYIVGQFMGHYDPGYHGMSGSGAYYNNDGNRYVYGVLSHGATNGSYTNYVMLNSNTFSDLGQFIINDIPEIQNNSVKARPNPTNDRLHVESEFPIEEYRILDQYGKTLFISEEFARSIEIDMTNYSNGIYLLQIQTLRGINVERVIKL